MRDGPGRRDDVRVEIAVDPDRALVHEQGWQSFSPSATYRLGQPPARPVSEARRTGNYRPDAVAPADAYQGEGLLALDPGTGDGVHVVAASSPDGEIASVRATWEGERLLVTADGPVEHRVHEEGVALEVALARWADGVAAGHVVHPLRPPPTVWCSWYHYYEHVTEDDVLENLRAMADLELPVDVVQIDDGWQAELGDWLTTSDRFRSLAATVDRIRADGRRAGVWVAPFFLGARSETLRAHPDWAVQGADPGTGWDQQLVVLDVTRPGAEAYLREMFGRLTELGFNYVKADFLFAGAMPGDRADPAAAPLDAYRHGLRVIREAIGPETFLLGCGAPQLPSVGLVDAMRIGPDISHRYESEDGDASQPAQRNAARNALARAWAHGRWWVNDADCLVAAPHVERREEWAGVVEASSGLRSSSDRLSALDGWGLDTTRRLLRRGLTAPVVG